jgi:hypothetical protein
MPLKSRVGLEQIHFSLNRDSGSSRLLKKGLATRIAL